MSPTRNPYVAPTFAPTREPHTDPTPEPTFHPVPLPSARPRSRPTMEPFALPTPYPISRPTPTPSTVPTFEPTYVPTIDPTQLPTVNTDPTAEPTMMPTMDPRITVCRGKMPVEDELTLGKSYPHDGCASLFWRPLDHVGGSYITTVCSCETVGNLVISDQMMKNAGLARSDGYPTISSVVTGNFTSLTIYARSDMTGPDKYVIGPRSSVDLSKVQRNSGSLLTWDNKVQSVSQMSWNQCVTHEVI